MLLSKRTELTAIEGKMFTGDAGEEVETQSSQAIAQTP
jgi:hypothetical protein